MRARRSAKATCLEVGRLSVVAKGFSLDCASIHTLRDLRSCKTSQGNSVCAHSQRARIGDLFRCRRKVECGAAHRGSPFLTVPSSVEQRENIIKLTLLGGVLKSGNKTIRSNLPSYWRGEEEPPSPVRWLTGELYQKRGSRGSEHVFGRDRHGSSDHPRNRAATARSKPRPRSRTP